MGAVKLIINSDISTDYSKDNEKLLKKFGIPFKISNDKLFFISMNEVEFSTSDINGNDFIIDMLSDIPKFYLGGTFSNFTDNAKKAVLQVFGEIQLSVNLINSSDGESDWLNFQLNNDLTIKYSLESDEEGYENEDEEEDLDDEDEVAELVSTAEISSEKNTTVTDIDGNSYNLVEIDTQLWISKNLNVSKYRNGDEIPHVQDEAEWAALTTGAWCYYENKEENGTTYGKLYNWYAVNDPRGLAPEGFHIPSVEEWNYLTEYLGGEKVAGGKMKEEGTTHWDKPNKNATNTSCFTALPGGYRFRNGLFYSIGKSGYWWSSSKEDTDRAWNLWMANDESYVVVNYNNLFANGFSVRCLKD